MHIATQIGSAVRASVVAVFFAALAAQPAAGQILFDGSIPPANVDDIGFNDPDAGGQRLAEDFQLGGVATMTGVTFLGGYYSSDSPGTDMFTLTLFGDASGLPDPANVIAQMPIVADRTETGVSVFGIRLFSYAAQFSGIQLDANTRYWLMIVNDTSSDPDDDWVWAGRHQGGVYARSFDGGLTWFDTPEGAFSFQILGQEPTSVEASTWGSLKALYRGTN